MNECPNCLGVMYWPSYCGACDGNGCSACDGDGEVRVYCDYCGGLGEVSDEELAAWIEMTREDLDDA